MNQNQKEEIYVNDEEVKKLMQCLPKTNLKGVINPTQLVLYEGFWYSTNSTLFRNVLTLQKHFVARDDDIFITGLLKTGTTWLKSLLFVVVNRQNHPNIIDKTPYSLLTHHPQELVCNLEADVYGEAFEYPRPHHLNEVPSPRLFSTHIPYTSLPNSIKTSKCRILYICRNPLDTLVSFYYFYLEFIKKLANGNGEDFVQLSIEDIFEDFCQGKTLFGPFFEHILEFWNMSLERPDKVLFLKYEDLKHDLTPQLKRLAEFIGMPFSPREENEGVVRQIVDFCDIKNMKELDANKSGVINKLFEKKSYFRKGEVGDWTNHFTPAMVEKMNKLMEENFEGSCLSFKIFSN